MREYEKHEAANGKPANHQFAKEVRASTCIAMHHMQVQVWKGSVNIIKL